MKHEHHHHATRNTPALVMIGVVILGVIAMGIWNFWHKQAASEHAVFQDISAREAHALIQEQGQDANFVILDVRTPAEFQQGHIRNARNLDFYAQTFQNQLDQLDKQKTYLVYCRSGNRSGQTLRIMRQLGFEKAYNVRGGIGQWSADQLPLTR